MTGDANNRTLPGLCLNLYCFRSFNALAYLSAEQDLGQTIFMFKLLGKHDRIKIKAHFVGTYYLDIDVNFFIQSYALW